MATATAEQTATNNAAAAGAVARLEGEHGTTSISEKVVSKVASIAAREVEGVASLGGAMAGAIANAVSRIRSEEHRTSGIGVEVGARQAAVDISMTVQYPASIHEVAANVRQNVIDRIEQITGLEVVEVNISVIDLAFDGPTISNRVI